MKKKSQIGNELVIGIDIHPDHFTAAAMTGTNGHDAKRLWVKTKMDISKWNAFLEKNVPERSILVMEAGCNSFEFAERAKMLNYVPVVLESCEVGKLSKTYCKNDKEDAVKLAKIYISGMITEEVWQPDITTLERREILSAYGKAVRDCTRNKNSLRSYLTKHGIRLKKGVRLTLESTVEVIFSLNEWTSSQKTIIKNMCDNILHAEKQRKELREHMAKEVLAVPMMRDLMRLTGIRIICAYAVISAVGDIKRFRTPKKLVSYLGLTPNTRSSGNSTWGRGISKKGRKEVKTYLIQAAQSIFRSNCESSQRLKLWGLKLMYKKSKNTAVTAVARKLVVAIWYLLNGFLPEIIDITKEIKQKMKKVAEELGIYAIRALGYRSYAEFIEEYSGILLFRT